MPIENLTILLDHMNSEENLDHYKQLEISRKIYTKVINCFRKKIDVLPLEAMVNFIYNLVKMNKK